MITSIEIENLRGIRSGRLDGLAPLTILTGPNASGKSTILDALLIAASPEPADAVGRAVRRHPASSGGARWLFLLDQSVARVQATPDKGQRWERRLTWFDHCDEEMQNALAGRRSPPPYSMIGVKENEFADEAVNVFTAIGGDNQYETGVQQARGLSKIPFVRLVDPGRPIPLHLTFSEVRRAGRLEAVHDLLGGVIRDFERLEIIALTERDFGLAVTKGGASVPVALSGDGIQALIQVALEIAVVPRGLVLVEEPEVYQHPKAIRQGARVLLANVRRGVQTVLTTHSLELIDDLIAEAQADDLERMALFNLAVEAGQLRSGKRTGSEIAFARETLENDLR